MRSLNDSGLLIRLTLLELGVVVALVALCWRAYGAHGALATGVGGSIACLAYLVSGLVSLRKREAAKSAYAQLMMAELLKVGLVIMGFGLLFNSDNPLLEPLHQGRNVLLLVVACISVVVAHALGGVFLYRNVDLPDLSEFSVVRDEHDTEND